MRTDHKVLVIALDPFLAALIGALVERVGMQAAFPDPDEIADAALERVRPIAAILLGARTSEADSELFLARASKKKVPVIMFGTEDAMARRSDWLARNALRGYVLPGQFDAICEHLEDIASIKRDGRGAPGGGGGRRRPRADVGPNGALLFYDETGQRWHVYDRRKGEGERRRASREFVSEAGVVRACDVLDSELGQNSADVLAVQLSRATPRS
jgi:hypothetical protein